MRTLHLIILAILLAFAQQSTLAFSTITQIKPTNHYEFISITANETTDTNGTVKVVRVLVTPLIGIKPQNISGILSVYRNGKLIVACDVRGRVLNTEPKAIEPSTKHERVLLEFTISSEYVNDARFSVNLWDPDAPGFSEYWFYLRDFIGEAASRFPDESMKSPK